MFRKSYLELIEKEIYRVSKKGNVLVQSEVRPADEERDGFNGSV